MLAVAPKRAAASVIAILAALMTPVPLSFRKRVAVWCARLRMPGKQTFTLALLEDLATADPGAFHRFLWSNHLAYAITYEVPKRYGTCRIAEANQVLLSRISAILRLRGLDPDNTVEAVLDVGCSTGALLRYIETDVFRSASVLRGIDIDKHAVAAGTEYLSSAGSKVALVSAISVRSIGPQETGSMMSSYVAAFSRTSRSRMRNDLWLECWRVPVIYLALSVWPTPRLRTHASTTPPAGLLIDRSFTTLTG
jgi:hypothetical protein